MSTLPPTIDDFETFSALPSDLQGLLEQQNGAILYGGALHVRGACFIPDWHSLRQVWTGDFALWQRFPTLRPTDVPFAQDAVGDQFLLRQGEVVRMRSETGDIEHWEFGVEEFFKRVQEHPVEVLEMEPLLQFQNEGGKLLPGQLISVYPPFCTTQASAGVSLRAVSTFDRLGFLSDFCARVAAKEEQRSTE